MPRHCRCRWTLGPPRGTAIACSSAASLSSRLCRVRSFSARMDTKGTADDSLVARGLLVPSSALSASVCTPLGPSLSLSRLTRRVGGGPAAGSAADEPSTGRGCLRADRADEGAGAAEREAVSRNEDRGGTEAAAAAEAVAVTVAVCVAAAGRCLLCRWLRMPPNCNIPTRHNTTRHSSGRRRQRGERGEEEWAMLGRLGSRVCGSVSE